MTPLQFTARWSVWMYGARAAAAFHLWSAMKARPVPDFTDAQAISWRGLHSNSLAIKIGGSPCETFAEAEEACNVMLNARKNDGGPHDELPPAAQSESYPLTLEAASRDPNPS
jgi:hypothetical protein